MTRFVASGAMLGAFVPLLLIALRQLVDWIHAGPGGASLLLMRVTVGLWPSSIMLMGTADQSALDARTTAAYAGAIAVNVILYAALALVFWYGIRRNKLVLIVMTALIVIGWVALSRL